MHRAVAGGTPAGGAALALRGRWTYLALMGISGFTAFNALFYAAAHHTTAVNLSLIQGMIPCWCCWGAWSSSGCASPHCRWRVSSSRWRAWRWWRRAAPGPCAAAPDIKCGRRLDIAGVAAVRGLHAGVVGAACGAAAGVLLAVAGVAALASLPLLAAEVLSRAILAYAVGLGHPGLHRSAAIVCLDILHPRCGTHRPRTLQRVPQPPSCLWPRTGRGRAERAAGRHHAVALAMVPGGIPYRSGWARGARFEGCVPARYQTFLPDQVHVSEIFPNRSGRSSSKPGRSLRAALRQAQGERVCRRYVANQAVLGRWRLLVKREQLSFW